MTLKFLYITQDPFTNNSEEFVRILAIRDYPTFPSNGGESSTGQLYDPNGNVVAGFQQITGNLYTEATAYPYTFSEGWIASQIIIVPPGWKFTNFGVAIAVQGTLEEVLMVH